MGETYWDTEYCTDEKYVRQFGGWQCLNHQLDGTDTVLIVFFDNVSRVTEHFNRRKVD